MDSRVVEILKTLVEVSWIDVAFLIESSGHLLMSVGTSPAFSHSGQFRHMRPQPSLEEPSSCLYLTALTRETYLGVLFSSRATIDDVRAMVGQHLKDMTAMVAG